MADVRWPVGETVEGRMLPFPVPAPGMIGCNPIHEIDLDIGPETIGSASACGMHDPDRVAIVEAYGQSRNLSEHIAIVPHGAMFGLTDGAAQLGVEG